MTLATNQNLAAATITYNGVQFGGADSQHQSLPPNYRFSGQFEYDEGRTTVIGTLYNLNISTTFYHNSSEGSLADIVESVRLKLQQPGKTLKIVGLGTAFGTITHDERWGPTPISFEWQPLGIYAWQCSYNIQFFIKECDSNNTSTFALAAFNFSTTWQNDYEGICERVIDGTAEIPIHRAGGVPPIVADNIRESINVVCPEGFRRRVNTWREGASKNQLKFVIIDAMEAGTPLPVGCTSASGNLSYSSQGPGFAQATVTLSMDLRISPAYHPSLAGVIFLTAANTKQTQMQAGIGNGVVIPKSVYISNGKFDRARDTSASMSWALTKCTADMLRASGLWKPVIDTNYTEWRQSIENLWNNRGAATINGGVIGSIASENIEVNLCTNTTDVRIGDSGAVAVSTSGEPNFQFTCPNIPADGGWIYYEPRVRMLRQNGQTWHKKAVSYLPEPGYDPNLGPTPIYTDPQLGGYPFSQGEAEEHDIEYNGLPTLWILLQFRGLRVKHQPEMPILTTVGGLPVVEVTHQIDGPRIAFDALSCPVWGLRGWRVYRVNGYVPSIKPVESNVSCAAPDGNKKEY